MILKLGMKHQAMLYKVNINHDRGMTLTYLQQGQLRSLMHLNGENVIKLRKTCWEYANGHKIYVYEKKFDPRECLSLPLVYLHVYDHNIQTSSSLKLLGLLKPNMEHG